MMKNDYYIDTVDPIVIIYLTHKGKELSTVVDLEDFSLVDSFPNKWYAHAKSNGGFYVRGSQKINGKSSYVYLHRFLFQDVNGKEVDHINRDTLDNRRSNLRLGTHRQNMQNQSHRNPLSGERGVYFDKRDNTWYARVVVNGEYVHLGRFKDKELAVKAVKQARKDLMPFSKECRS